MTRSCANEKKTLFFNALTNTRHKQVHGGHRLPVRVVSHIKRLDVAGVVVNEHSCVVPGLCQPALVLRLRKRSTTA